MKERFEKRTEQFFDAVDELFDELMARTMTIFEALGIVTGEDWSPPRSEKDEAIRRMVKDVVRDIQNRVKDEYPNYKDLK